MTYTTLAFRIEIFGPSIHAGSILVTNIEFLDIDGNIHEGVVNG